MDYEHSHTRAENASDEYILFALHKLGLATSEGSRERGKWKIDLRILNQLSLSKATAYELKWKRLKDSNEHYSTVLRAFGRLERKGFVKLVSSNEEGRRNKTYTLTLLGELVVTLARKGLEGASLVLAQNSASYRQCLKIWNLAPETLEEILKSRAGKAVTYSDLDFYVRNAAFEHARWFIIDSLNWERERPQILEDLREIAHIDWLSEWLALNLEKYIEKESDWLQTLKDFKRISKAHKARE